MAASKILLLPGGCFGGRSFVLLVEATDSASRRDGLIQPRSNDCDQHHQDHRLRRLLARFQTVSPGPVADISRTSITDALAVDAALEVGQIELTVAA